MKKRLKIIVEFLENFEETWKKFWKYSKMFYENCGRTFGKLMKFLGRIWETFENIVKDNFTRETCLKL